jgi:hypothetical protein
MTSPWKANEFKIAINMAGAVSAGAYTAGVLDFLMEALEEWEKNKVLFRSYLANSSPTGSVPDPVPLHSISIEAFSGASSGGMCAAVAAVMIQRSFDHVRDKNATGTNNTLYEASVNQIDIYKFLAVRDLKNGKPLVSLLDSTVIDEVAESALSLTSVSTPSYVSKNLRLFLTLTNVRGVSYQLYADPSPNLDEFFAYYADRLQFELVQPGGTTSALSSVTKPLPLGDHQAYGWGLLREAVKATGAFPLFLAPRRLTRDLGDYKVPMWVPIGAPDPDIVADLPSAPAETIETLNVDGGVTDNDPFELPHDFLASQNPKATGSPRRNPRDPLEANCAVISVAPLPSGDRYDPGWDVSKAEGLFVMLRRLVTVVLSQCRFLGESLAVLTKCGTFSRFIVAPSDDGKSSGTPLQSARLGGFAGYMSRSFRAHDFLLGRRNCQEFLRSHLRLPLDNPIVAAGLNDAGAHATDIKSRFATDPPDGVAAPSGKVWMPLIPLVGSASQTIPLPDLGRITVDDITTIADEIIGRFGAITSGLLNEGSAARVLKLGAAALCTWPLRLWVRTKIVAAITEKLGPDVDT